MAITEEHLRPNRPTALESAAACEAILSIEATCGVNDLLRGKAAEMKKAGVGVSEGSTNPTQLRTADTGRSASADFKTIPR